MLQVRSGAGSDPGLFQDLPYGGGGHLHPQHQQVAVQPSVPPLGILAGQAQHQGADGTHRPRPTRALWSGHLRMAAGEQVTVPAQYRIGAHQQPHSAPHVERQSV